MDKAVANADIACIYCTNPAIIQNSERAQKQNSNNLQLYKKKLE